MRLTALALAAALTLSGPALASPESDIASARPTIEAANSGWIPSMQAKDATAVAEAYASDAVFVTNTGQAWNGHDSILQMMRDRLDDDMQVFGGGLTQKGLVALKPGLLLEWGEGGLTWAGKDGRMVKSYGPYTTIWRHEPNGAWMIIRNLSF